MYILKGLFVCFSGLNFFTEKFVEGFVVDKFWWVVLPYLLQLCEDFLFDIFNEFIVIPEFIKPRLEVGSVPVVIYLKIKFNVAVI